ncbi:5'/3'-nucleotidase SurE [Agrobacterium tumefaciens]|uniref:5'/3'-nucleotidase SurE n=1 Tax=Agrobacterium tumefaciens TaxID=358 RepID=UPI0021D146CE|nr:5'/3'-nucleotidase SurE [Agrobacterium tumefaciens]UXS01051.1 5'/3'-nucleotidase SurE [Agrobacterium tumefaciens]
MIASSGRIRRVLLTNDDGIDAPGLATLRQVAEEIADEVWVVAPDHDQSGSAQSLSLHAPLRVTERGDRTFSISGTPADCVVMALRHLMPSPPDLLLSGINRGANLGVETVFSGTVGAAMTGLLLGVPSIALSQAFSDRFAVRWPTARALAPDVIMKAVRGTWSGKVCLNINFPDADPGEAGPCVVARQGAGLLNDVKVVSGTDPRNIGYHWLKLERLAEKDDDRSETEIIRRGAISITPLAFDRTASESLDFATTRPSSSEVSQTIPVACLSAHPE